MISKEKIFSIGDKVALNGFGDVYPAYITMANYMGLDGYSHERHPEANQELKVVSEGVHDDANRRLLGVRDSYGYEYVVGESGLLLVEKNKQKTKTTYKLVTDMTNGEIAKAMIDGEVFYSKNGEVSFSWNGSSFVNDIGIDFHCSGKFYRKVEKEIDWHTEAIEFVDKSNCICLDDTINFMLTKPNGETIDEYDSEVLELCRLILRSIGEL